MVIDLRKCEGCVTIDKGPQCIEGCNAEHFVPKGQEWIKVFEVEGAGGHNFFLPRPCMQCENAPCTKVCPVRATYHNEEGVVLVDQERCIGCRMCMAACPYGVRQFNWEQPENPPGATFATYSPEFPVPHRRGTVVWSHQAYPQEEHILVLEGYKLETDKIDAAHREGSFKFLADKVGTFNFWCDVECDTHDLLQKGHLKVTNGGSAGSSGAASGRTATSLAFRANTSILTRSGGPLTLTAVLTDTSGVPIPKAEVRFYLAAELAGTEGQMEIGVGKTDANGVATLEYQPHIVTPKLKITAHVDALGVYDESQQIIEIEQLGEPPPAYAEAPTGLEHAPNIWLGSDPHGPSATVWSWSINHWGPLAIAVVVLGVWSTLGFALYQIYGISRQRARR
jgi:Fe-S-cluster-containing hydrogenase component 2